MGNFGGRLWRAGFRGWWHRPWSHCAARVQRVQRVLPALGRRVQRVVVSPLRGDEVLYAAPRQNQTTAPAARGNAPLLVLRTTFPPEGELYLPLSFYSHKQFKV